MRMLIIVLVFLLVGCDNKSISTKEAYKMMQKEDVILLDVREDFEYEGGHLKNAINIPLEDLEKRLNELNKDNKIIVYCLSGVRADIALEILEENGFNNIYTFGGIEDWNYELYE